MTVNKVGRPSKAHERRKQILAAARRVVAKEGLAGATASRVAEESGLSRTLLLHYFGDRDSLLRAFIDSTVAEYGIHQLRPGGAHVVDDVGRLFDTGSFRSRADLAIWLELVAQSTRNSIVRDALREVWTTYWLPELEHQLAHGRPDASQEAVRTTAHALSCLFEGHWALLAQGLDGPDRARHSAHAAQILMAALT